MRGLLDLDRGRLGDALAHYKDAHAAMPGWWLVLEHIAEIAALEGELEIAEAIYDQVVAETGSPELMGAHADVLEALGDSATASTLREEARRILDNQVARWPSAAGGHAVEFLLDTGDITRALELARDAFQRMPSGEASVLLAEALLQSGEADEAEAVLRRALEAGHESAAIHRLAANVYAELGDVERAAHHDAVATAINPLEN